MVAGSGSGGSSGGSDDEEEESEEEEEESEEEEETPTLREPEPEALTETRSQIVAVRSSPVCCIFYELHITEPVECLSH